jgi:uncharacterized protein
MSVPRLVLERAGAAASVARALRESSALVPSAPSNQSNGLTVANAGNAASADRSTMLPRAISTAEEVSPSPAFAAPACSAGTLLHQLSRLQRQAGAQVNTPTAVTATATTQAMPRAVIRAAHAQPDVVHTHPPAVTAATPARAGTSELDRLRTLLARRPSGVPASPAPARSNASDRSLPGQLLAPGLRYVERWIPCATPPPFHPDWCDADPVAPRHLLCFDTETTGLAGGSGTRAFLIGASDWQQGGLRLRQLYIETLAAEAAMLAEFARWLGPEQVLVSYNGRCYDAPLLSTRYRLARQPNPLAGRLHLDLLTPVRRRFRRVWENCRLVTAERELLGVVRHDDLPGSQAPAAWLEYLRGGSAARLRRVLAHNAQDLDSLARLLLALPTAAAG